jgi:hypothetical protein
MPLDEQLDQRILICDLCKSSKDVNIETDTCNDLLVVLQCLNSSHPPDTWHTCKECSCNNLLSNTFFYKYTLGDEWTRHLRLCHTNPKALLNQPLHKKIRLEEEIENCYEIGDNDTQQDEASSPSTTTNSTPAGVTISIPFNNVFETAH